MMEAEIQSSYWSSQAIAATMAAFSAKIVLATAASFWALVADLRIGVKRVLGSGSGDHGGFKVLTDFMGSV